MIDSDYDEISDTSMERSHVVILGAGASKATCPGGDLNGRAIPLMNNLISVCGLGAILGEAGHEVPSEDFEQLYGALHNNEGRRLLSSLEDKVFAYFDSLCLPVEPTIYDYLVMSLRPKDLIATFNWDPFLWQAMERNHRWAKKAPQAVFLHGNVSIGHCLDDRITGPRGASCPQCGEVYQDSKLLFPVVRKNYSSDPYIQTAWTTLRNRLENAYLLTVFGYSAPVSDQDAIQLLKSAWGNASDRNLEQVEIINVDCPEMLRETWRPFIHSHHYEIHKSFNESILAQHPRRSCEAMWAMLMENQIPNSDCIPSTDDWNELRIWFEPRLEVEELS